MGEGLSGFVYFYFFLKGGCCYLFAGGLHAPVISTLQSTSQLLIKSHYVGRRNLINAFPSTAPVPVSVNRLGCTL